MEGLVLAIGTAAVALSTAAASSFELLLEHLCAVPLLIAEIVSYVPALPAFSWGILVGTLVVVSLNLMRQHTRRGVKALKERCPVPDEVCEEGSKNSGPITTANDALKSSEVETSLPLKQLMAPSKRVQQGAVTKPLSRAGNPLQTSPGPEVLSSVLTPDKQPTGAGNGDQFTHRSDLHGVPNGADLSVCLQPVDRGDRGSAKQLQKQKQRSEAARLQTENTSLQCEHSSLKDEIRQLQQQLQAEAAREDRFTWLQEQLFMAESCCSELGEKFRKDCRYLSSIYQILNTYKQMAQDLNQELQRNTVYYNQEIRYYQARAEEARVATERLARERHAVRKENDYYRRMLANAELFFQPFPGGPFARRCSIRGPERLRSASPSPGLSGPQEGGAGSRSKSPQTQGHLQVLTRPPQQPGPEH